MKPYWRPMRLDDVLSLEYGKPLDDSRRTASGRFPAYGANGVKTFTNEYLVDYPSIVVGRKGSAGELTLTDEKFWPLDVTYYVAFDTRRYDRKFLYHLLSTLDLPRLAKGVKPGINRNEVYAIEVRIPDLAMQQRVASILDEAFQGIAAARANAERNLRNARAVFDGQLDTIFGRHGLRANATIGSVAEVFDGPHATPKTVDHGPIFLGIGALEDGRINLAETRHVTADDYRLWTRRVRPEPGDVVFSYETRLGQAAIIPDELQCCLGRRMGLVRVDRERLDPRFFVYQYISPIFRRFLEGKTVRGATVDRISIKDFPSFPIAIPPIADQQRIATQLGELRDESDRLATLYRRKLAALDELKQSFLHHAFTGQLTERTLAAHAV